MRRFVACVAATVSVFGAATVATSATASAGTPSWLHIQTPTAVTVYNGAAATITPSATMSGTRVVSSRWLTVYRNGRQYNARRTVRLSPGSYQTITSGTYRYYVNQRVRKYHRVLHPGGRHVGNCIVHDVYANGETASVCTSSYYPGEHVVYRDYKAHRIGDHFQAMMWFNGEYVSTPYYVTQRKYSGPLRYSSSRRGLTVHNGGFRRVFNGYGNYETINFRPPSARWHINYAWACNDYENFAIWVYRADGELEDLAANDLGTYGGNTAYEHDAGTFYLEVDADSGCDWSIVVRNG